MPTPPYRQGDTWPPLTGTISDDNGPVNVQGKALQLILKSGATVVTGTPTNLDDGTTPTRGKWTYTPALNDFSIVGDYFTTIKVTWSAITTPPEVETYSNDAKNDPTVHVTAKLA